MSTKSAQSPLPILIVVGLAGMSLVQLIAPGLVPPGATLFLLGVVFLLLYAINWIRDPHYWLGISGLRNKLLDCDLRYIRRSRWSRAAVWPGDRIFWHLLLDGF